MRYASGRRQECLRSLLRVDVVDLPLQSALGSSSPTKVKNSRTIRNNKSSPNP